jgi:hypothetical protein
MGLGTFPSSTTDASCLMLDALINHGNNLQVIPLYILQFHF